MGRYEKHSGDVLVIDAGVVTYAQRLSLGIAAPLDLRDFPFDRHTLAVEIRSVFSSVEEVTFAVRDELTGSAADRGLTGWSVAAPSGSITTRHAP